LYPYVISYNDCGWWQIGVVKLKNTFQHLSSHLCASLQNIVSLHLLASIRFAQNKTMGNICCLLENSSKGMLFYSQQNWNHGLVCSTSNKSMVIGLEGWRHCFH
jgi:hypothetical protein